MGSNQEGDGESNPVQLDIKCKNSFVSVSKINNVIKNLDSPSCKLGQLKVYGIARFELTEIRCELDANPTDVQFSWKFNNSDNAALVVDLPQNQITSDRTRSILSYKPIAEYDYGTLLCSGKNEIGEQKEPCVFYINPAGTI